MGYLPQPQPVLNPSTGRDPAAVRLGRRPISGYHYTTAAYMIGEPPLLWTVSSVNRLVCEPVSWGVRKPRMGDVDDSLWPAREVCLRLAASTFARSQGGQAGTAGGRFPAGRGNGVTMPVTRRKLFTFPAAVSVVPWAGDCR